MSGLIEVASNYQGIRMAELLLRYRERPRPIQDIEVLWYYGEMAKTNAWWGHAEQVYTPVSMKWWDGYDAHKIVVIDNIIKEDLRYLNRLTDKFPFRAETKGGSRQVQYTRIIFASEVHPRLLGVKNKILNRCEIIEAPGTEVGGSTDPDFLNDCDCFEPEEISDAELNRITGWFE